MEVFVRTGDVGVQLCPSGDNTLSCATEAELLSEWLPYCPPRLKRKHAEEGRSCCSCSSSSSSQASLSSASISTLSKDLFDFDEELSSCPWSELRAKGPDRVGDEDFYRFSAAVDLNLPAADASFSHLDLFPDNVKPKPDDVIFDPDSESGRPRPIVHPDNAFYF